MTNVSRELQRDLLHEQANLAGLVSQTIQAIGGTAQQTYNAVVADTGSSLTPEGGVPRVDNSYLHYQGLGTPYVSRYRAPLDYPTPLPDSNIYDITSTVIEDRERRISLLGKSFRVPGTVHRGVRLELTRASEEDAYARRPERPVLSIRETGAAFVDDACRYTAPQKSIGRPRDYADRRYPETFLYVSPAELYDDYASRFTGALVVATTVATAFGEAHDFAAPTDHLLELVDAWQARRTCGNGAIHPRLGAIVPFSLAQRAGIKTLH